LQYEREKSFVALAEGWILRFGLEGGGSSMGAVFRWEGAKTLMSRHTGEAFARRKSEPDLVGLGRRIRRARDRGELRLFCDAVLLHSRKAYDLIAIADAVDAGLLQEEVVQEIGWSKARLIAERAGTKPTARRAIVFARNHTLPALVAFFKHDGNGMALVTKSFHLTPEQARELDAALLRAGARQQGPRMDGRNDALMRIVRSYSQL
jgi:hypothetical protein